MGKKKGLSMIIALMLVMAMGVSGMTVFADSIPTGTGNVAVGSDTDQGIITITKLQEDPTLGTVTQTGSEMDMSAYTPLDGVGFAIYAATLNLAASTTTSQPDGTPNVDWIMVNTNVGGYEYYAIQQPALATGLTGSNGVLSFTNLPVGMEGSECVYVVMEDNSISTNLTVTSMADPSVIPLPMDIDQNPATPQSNQVYIYPKNVVNNPSKTALPVDPGSATPNILPFEVDTQVPSSIINPTSGTPLTITVTDKLDPRLVGLTGNGNITVSFLAGQESSVPVTSYFISNFNTDTNTLSITLDSTQASEFQSAISPAINSSTGPYTIQMIFDTQLVSPSTSTVDASTLENTASLVYQDPEMTIKNDSNTTQSSLLAIDIAKIDPTLTSDVDKTNPALAGAPLAGATFVLYTDPDAANAAAQYFSGVTSDGNPSYYTGDNTDLSNLNQYLQDAAGNPIVATTGSDGTATFSSPVALTADTYYLVETNAPTKYNVLGQPVVLQIQGDSTNGYTYSATLEGDGMLIDNGNSLPVAHTPTTDDGGNTVYTNTVSILDIPNRQEILLPLAGGTGTMPTALIGLILVVGALSLGLVYNAKRKKATK